MTVTAEAPHQVVQGTPQKDGTVEVTYRPSTPEEDARAERVLKEGIVVVKDTTKEPAEPSEGE